MKHTSSELLLCVVMPITAQSPEPFYSYSSVLPRGHAENWVVSHTGVSSLKLFDMLILVRYLFAYDFLYRCMGLLHPFLQLPPLQDLPHSSREGDGGLLPTAELVGDGGDKSPDSQFDLHRHCNGHLAPPRRIQIPDSPLTLP